MGKRKLFVEGDNFYRRAYFGWQDQNSALTGVRMGYKDSADCLVEEALLRGEENNIRVLDTYIFPIIFLYRHSIETSIKAIHYRFCGEIPEGGHDLVTLWDNTYTKVVLTLESKEFIEEVKNYKEQFRMHSLSGIDFNEIRQMFLEFNKIKDNKADVFRYLIDKKGELYFAETKFVDYDNLKENMNYLYGVLDFLYFITDDYLSS